MIDGWIAGVHPTVIPAPQPKRNSQRTTRRGTRDAAPSKRGAVSGVKLTLNIPSVARTGLGATLTSEMQTDTLNPINRRCSTLDDILMPGKKTRRIFSRGPGGLIGMFVARLRSRVTAVMLPAMLLGVLSTGGCGLAGLGKEGEPVERPDGTLGDGSELKPGRPSLATQGTIGSITYVQGQQFMLVRGYGLVVGLNRTGSTKCRPSLRKDLLREIRRARSGKPHIKYEQTPEEVINSPDTAVVVVDAKVPAGAAKRRRFDVSVRAVDEDTTSLVGGILMPCELKILAALTPGEIKQGKTHAKAMGRVFVNPFGRSAESATVVNLREGRIIGGGTNVLDRRLGLVTSVESYATVRQISDAINRRFPGDEPVADADSPTHVALKIPPAFRHGQEGGFLRLVSHLPISSSPVELEARAKLLAGELVRTDVSIDEVALALEGVGESVIPMIRPLYTHSRRPVSYYAARTGYRLGDELAIDVMIRHVTDAKSPFRLRAIRELETCPKRYRAAAVLRKLLADEDLRIRIRAYEALRLVDPQGIVRVVVGQRDPQNFLLEVVPSDGPPLIYARQTGYPRIALIGGDRMVCKPPLLYSEAGKPLTLSAGSSDNMITVLKKEPKGMLGPYYVPLSVPMLTRFLGGDLQPGTDGILEGLGIGYAEVLNLLYRLYEKKAINATMRWEEPSVEELIGTLEPMGRPESEL